MIVGRVGFPLEEKLHLQELNSRSVATFESITHRNTGSLPLTAIPGIVRSFIAQY